MELFQQTTRDQRKTQIQTLCLLAGRAQLTEKNDQYKDHNWKNSVKDSKKPNQQNSKTVDFVSHEIGKNPRLECHHSKEHGKNVKNEDTPRCLQKRKKRS